MLNAMLSSSRGSQGWDPSRIYLVNSVQHYYKSIVKCSFLLRVNGLLKCLKYFPIILLSQQRSGSGSQICLRTYDQELSSHMKAHQLKRKKLFYSLLRTLITQAVHRLKNKVVSFYCFVSVRSKSRINTCTHTHIYIHTQHTYIHKTHAYTYTYSDINTHIHICIDLCTHIHIHTQTCIYTHINMTDMYMYTQRHITYTHTCNDIHMHIYIHPLRQYNWK